MGLRREAAAVLLTIIAIILALVYFPYPLGPITAFLVASTTAVTLAKGKSR